MQIKYWKNFSKRTNSTKRPTGGTTLDVILQEPCSVEAPSFILSIIDTTINYIQAFGDYYHVTDKTILDRNRMRIDCAMDELATARSDIFGASAFIERSTVLYNNEIVDPLVSTDGITSCQILSPSETTPFAKSNSGYYLLATVNDSTFNNPGLCQYYVLGENEMQNLRRYLNGNPSNVVQWAEKIFGHLFDAVVSCKYIPIVLTSGTISAANIVLGTEDSGVSAYRISGANILTHTDTFTVPDALIGSFRKLEPYTSFKLFIPNYGMVNLPGACVNSTVKVSYTLDLITGEVYAQVITVNNSTDNLIASIQYNTGIDIPITQLRSVTPNSISGIISGATAITGAMTGNPLLIGGSVAAGTFGIISGVADQGISVKGGIGGRSMFDHNKSYLYISSLGTTATETDALRQYYGKPYMEVNTLSQASGGYVKTRQASISTHLTPTETNHINAMLDSGVYLE